MPPMQVLALNGSPRLEDSNSQRLLAPLLAGMREAGAQVAQHYLARLSINYCTGCYGCWTRTPGKCSAWRDDMDLLLPQVQAADYLVLAFPLYVYTMPARVKAFLERLLPTVEPWMVPHPTRPGVTTHPHRSAKIPKLVILTSAGLAEHVHFSSLKLTLEQISSMTGMELAGLITRPAAGILEAPQFAELLAPYFAALKQAGGELTRDGAITPATQDVLEMDFLPMGAEVYIAQANSYFQYQLAKHGQDATPPPEAPMPPAPQTPAAS
jgi:multimeric flavodoxin WrbA